MVMETKPTPGPWKFVPWHIAEGPSEVRAPEGWLVCTTASDDDARLIAAAPDLLTSCKDLLLRCADPAEEFGPNHAVTQARAAIAKAEGRS
jgi:hypothetical protein